MQQSDSIVKLCKALSTAQGQLENAKKNSVNPHLKNRYANLTSVLDAIRETLSRNGIAYIQPFWCDENNNLFVETQLMCEGEWMRGKLKLQLDKPTMQSIGSAVSYARRYSLLAMVGISDEEDDDGHLASQYDDKRTQPKYVRNESSKAPLPPPKPTLPVIEPGAFAEYAGIATQPLDPFA